MKKIKVGIIGGSGYGGSELLRILLFHPAADIVFVTANEQAGKKVTSVHKNLLGLTDLSFVSAADVDSYDDVDVLFFALPHGRAMDAVGELPGGVRVIDLSGDFRIDDPQVFNSAYGFEHKAPELQKSFVYGLTEVNRSEIREARYIANPGCFATATLLALSPLVASGLLTGTIVADVKTGSSGSGIKPAANTHHPQRSNSFYAYKPFKHQHLPEIRQQLSRAGTFNAELVFMTHSMPVSRGIFASCYAETLLNITNDDLSNLFRKYYEDAFFIRMVEGSPDINWVKNSNFCDIAVHSNGRQIAVFSAIDNLVKGAAGQAVQNMNLMFGIEETTGLVFTGGNP